MRLAMFVCLGLCACYRGSGSAPTASSPPPAAAYSCFTMTSGGTRGSFCYADPARCESERGAAQADGGSTNTCYRQAPVSCFQLRGDPHPELEMCAAAAADCDLLRRIDRDKSGASADACEWRHSP
ncbi:MAG TPA: hypothetical protein VKE22_24990 [Haliangiales bacterium]|nr:hypothetical protein [Haliangiales bacterium]